MQDVSVICRLSSTTGFCLAIIRIAESLIRELASTTPSTRSSVRSMTSRSTTPVFEVSESSSAYPACRTASSAPLMISP
jgi:hypothetical protein